MLKLFKFDNENEQKKEVNWDPFDTIMGNENKDKNKINGNEFEYYLDVGLNLNECEYYVDVEINF